MYDENIPRESERGRAPLKGGSRRNGLSRNA
ncbi:hypothetical protein SAMN05444680_101213 [Variovorax sp. YR216]|nr:hypothetical protein SAMN05444680_101213 [Variovorax sp. YR216]